MFNGIPCLIVIALGEPYTELKYFLIAMARDVLCI